jgi:hypothetical protein
MVYEYSSGRGDEEITCKQSEAGGEYSTPYVRGCMIVVMTAGIGTAMDDINSSIGIIVTLKHASLLITQKIGTAKQLEVENASVRWHLGKGCNPKSIKKSGCRSCSYWYLYECCTG